MGEPGEEEGIWIDTCEGFEMTVEKLPRRYLRIALNDNPPNFNDIRNLVLELDRPISPQLLDRLKKLIELFSGRVTEINSDGEVQISDIKSFRLSEVFHNDGLSQLEINSIVKKHFRLYDSISTRVDDLNFRNRVLVPEVHQEGQIDRFRGIMMKIGLFFQSVCIGTGRFIWRPYKALFNPIDTLYNLGNFMFQLFTDPAKLLANVWAAIYQYVVDEPVEFWTEVILNVMLLALPIVAKSFSIANAKAASAASHTTRSASMSANVTVHLFSVPLPLPITAPTVAATVTPLTCVTLSGALCAVNTVNSVQIGRSIETCGVRCCSVTNTSTTFSSTMNNAAMDTKNKNISSESDNLPPAEVEQMVCHYFFLVY
jgi:hypothetical protein